MESLLARVRRLTLRRTGGVPDAGHCAQTSTGGAPQRCGRATGCRAASMKSPILLMVVLIGPSRRTIHRRPNR